MPPVVLTILFFIFGFNDYMNLFKGTRFIPRNPGEIIIDEKVLSCDR